MIEFDLNRALFLTYAGVGAAFLVLGTLVVFTAVIGRWGDWRLRRAQTRAELAQTAEVSPRQDSVGNSEEDGTDPELSAAIGLAIAMAVEAYQREQSENLVTGEGDSRTDSNGWREQGRIVAFDARPLRERDR